MKKLVSIALFCLFLSGGIAFGQRVEDGENTRATISYLISFVEKSDCTYIRNGRQYTAQEAVSHIQKKYGYFKNKIKTPEDFIRLAASKSLMSGKPYMVKTNSGELLKSEAWLLDALEAYRQKKRRESLGTSPQTVEQ